MLLISCEIKLILFILALSTSWVKLVTILFSIRVLIRKLFLNLKDALISVNHVLSQSLEAFYYFSDCSNQDLPLFRSV